MEVSGQVHAWGVKHPGKDPLYPLDGKLVGPQNRSKYGNVHVRGQFEISWNHLIIPSRNFVEV